MGYLRGHIETINTNLECGFILQFRNENHHDLWFKLHKKKCELCNKNLHSKNRKNIKILHIK